MFKHLAGVCGIYLLRNTVNGKVYVGQSVNMAARWKSHVKEAKRTRLNSHLYKAMRKHGLDAFDMCALEVLESPTQALMDERETFWVAAYNACDTHVGYNFRPGGQGSQVVDAEARERIAAKLRGRKMPPERIEQLRLASTGRPCPESAKQKLSKAHTGITVDKEQAAALKAAVAIAYEPVKAAKRHAAVKRIVKTDSYKTDAFRLAVSRRFKSVPRSQEARRNMSQAAKNRDPVAEQHRLEALRLVTQARWAAYRAKKLEEVCSA